MLLCIGAAAPNKKLNGDVSGFAVAKVAMARESPERSVETIHRLPRPLHVPTKSNFRAHIVGRSVENGLKGLNEFV